MTVRTRSAWIWIVVALALAGAATAQESNARVALDAWVTHINRSSMEQIEAYLTEEFTASFLRQVSLDQAMAIHRQLKGIAPFEVASVKSDTGTALVALLSSAGDQWFRARLSVAGEPPKIDGFLIQPTTEPREDVPAQLDWRTLDELAARLAEAHGLPGVAVAWARAGAEPQVGVGGVRARGSNDPIQPSDRFHIGSVSKSVTSSALGALVEEGALSWDATLAQLLPQLEMNPAYSGQTLRMLVRHRARIPQHLTMDDAEMARLNSLPGTPTQQRGAYAAEVLVEEPLDGDFHYSNAGYAIAGYLGERASGSSWARLVHDEVFEPLGLDTCAVGWPAAPAHPEQPRGHYGTRDDRTVQGLDEYELGAFIEPAGDIHCSAADLTRYGLAHLAGLKGQDGFLTSETIRELHRVIDDMAPYAAGWGVDPETGQHRHNGSAGTFFSYLVIDPRSEIVVTFLANAGPPDGQAAATQAVEEILARNGAGAGAAKDEQGH